MRGEDVVAPAQFHDARVRYPLEGEKIPTFSEVWIVGRGVVRFTRKVSIAERAEPYDQGYIGLVVKRLLNRNDVRPEAQPDQGVDNPAGALSLPERREYPATEEHHVIGEHVEPVGGVRY